MEGAECIWSEKGAFTDLRKQQGRIGSWNFAMVSLLFLDEIGKAAMFLWQIRILFEVGWGRSVVLRNEWALTPN